MENAMSQAASLKRRPGIRDDVGQKLRDLRKARNLTQSDLATRIGIQQSDLCRMENGQYRVGLETLVKILKECGVTFSEFFQEEPTGELTPEEAGLIQRFRRLGGPGRHQLLHFARFLCNEPAESQEGEAVDGVQTLFPPRDSGHRDT
jgi:transcriptional regulator with XRE-family HTH domain